MVHGTRLRVLIVEDSEDEARLLVHRISQAGFEPESLRVDTPEAMKAALAKQSWDVVLCDYVMPEFSGPAAFDLLKQSGLDLPFIVVSGKVGEDTALPMLMAGAHDFVEKGGMTRLVPAIERELRQARIRREHRIAEARFRALIENATDLVVVIGNDAAISYISPSLTRLGGYLPAEVTGRNYFEFVHPEDVEHARSVLASLLSHPGEIQKSETRFRHKDGRWVTLEVMSRNLLSDPAVRGIIVNARDITERKRSEEALERGNRALRTLSAGNTALVRVSDETALLAKMCSVIVAEGGYRAAVVAYRRDNPEKTVEPLASFGIDLSQVRQLPITWGEGEHGEGAIPRSIRLGAPQLVRNAESDPIQRARWQKLLPLAGAWSALSLPLHLDSQVPFGALYIVAAGDEAFDENESRLLSELANDLAFGVSVLRTRAAHEEATRKLRIGLERTVEAIAATLERRDPYTAGHERGVADLAVAIGREMALPEAVCEGIHIGALIHDLGKIQVPAEILSKPARLSAIEYELVKAHPEVGYDILKGIDFPWPVAQMALQHHERLNGSGYPRGLKGEEIVLEARVVAVADVVEAMASHRPYREGLGVEKALAEIERNRGTLYDAQAVDACLRLFREKGYRLPARSVPL